jgi:hypothetical protein
VQELAHRFSEQHLSHEESLFNEETFETTIRTLKGVLDDIDKRTAYKDEDYWRLYDAIETFLYGELDMEKPDELGTFWGISNFSSVWEDMCATWAFANYKDLIVYADTNIIFKGKRIANAKSANYFPIYKKEDFDDPFFIEFRGKKRWMRPDLVMQTKNKCSIFDNQIKIIIKKDRGSTVDFKVVLVDKTISKIYKLFCLNLKQVKGTMRLIGENEFRNYSKLELEKQQDLLLKQANTKATSPLLYDWKYIDFNFLVSYNKKIQLDVIKQLSYEFVLQEEKSSSNSLFAMPYFGNKKLLSFDDIENHLTVLARILESTILPQFLNFSDVQQIYLTDD